MTRPARIDVLLDPCISYGFESVLDFYTQSTPLRNGHLTINAGWDRGMHHYAGRYIKRPEDFLVIKKLFAVCRASVSAFRIFDHFDHSMADEVIGEATGGADELQLIRTFDVGGYTYIDIIEAPVVASVVIKADGVVVPGATVDPMTGIVTVTATAGQEITATCEFHRWVRFPPGFKLTASYENFKRQGIPMEWDEDFGP